MNGIVPVAVAVTIFIMMALFFFVLLWAGVELWRMHERIPATVFLCMAIVWVVVVTSIIAIAIERGL